jgi:hypothetical protein
MNFYYVNITFANHIINIAEKIYMSISMAEKTKTRQIIDIIINNLENKAAYCEKI